MYSFKLEVTCPSRGSRAGDEGVQVVAVVSLLAVVARVTGKLEITANSEARRLPDCGPGRDEGVAAATIIGELRQRLCDNLTRPHRSATQEAGHQVGVAGRGVTLKYVPFNITTDFCK